MEQAIQDKKFSRGLLTKRPFYRICPDVPTESDRLSSPLDDLGEKYVVRDNLVYMEVTQADFRRELDPSSHAINDRTVYINYRYSKEEDLFYEEDFPRYAFAYQQEILDDRLARLTGNDIQFDLAEAKYSAEAQEAYDIFKAGWADKRMENAWHFAAKSSCATGDTAFVGYMLDGKFEWKVLSYLNGDVLYPHYDRRTGKPNLLARTYTDWDENNNVRNYVDVWDAENYYRLVDVKYSEEDNTDSDDEHVLHTTAGDFDIDGYQIEFHAPHFCECGVPFAYHRRDDGPVWSPSQETIEHREAAFSRLAQSNHDFGLPILGLYGEGKKIKEIATSDMSYASKIFIIPSDGKAEFLNRQDASNAYKTELDMLEEKIYSQSMVIKAPELKSGDTPAAAIKLLYSDAYNKAMLEAQEYDEFVRKMIDIFKWGYGVESGSQLKLKNTRISYYIVPFLPVNDAEVTTNLSVAVQNGFCSKQTASEKFYFSTPNEWERIQNEKHEDDMHTLLIEEQRLEMQNEQNLYYQEEVSDIQTESQIEVIDAQQNATQEQDDDKKNVKKTRTRKGRVATGRGRGRPRTVGTDKWGNRDNENNWEKWNTSH
jgi:hypothetical protein